uniref:Uncharacterized protein n=1 Tax=Romanomermis culicivorax TaxID=13658 RepID=A0A915JE17_ROMCU
MTNVNWLVSSLKRKYKISRPCCMKVQNLWEEQKDKPSPCAVTGDICQKSSDCGRVQNRHVYCHIQIKKCCYVRVHKDD